MRTEPSWCASLGAECRRVSAGRQRGQVTVEFVLLATVLCAALLIPWAGGLSPAEWLLGAIVAAAHAFTGWLAVL
jgi:hypothetical protein